jgi:L-ribulokinase
VSAVLRTAIGVDFGSESARAVIVDVATGRELGSAVSPFAHGVIEDRLPDGGTPLPPDWALQDPDDYVASMGAAVREALRTSGIDAASVVGVGIDFTACTMLPTTADGTPLCRLPELRSEPHAWVKLWKHHAAQPEADRINALAAARGEAWLPRYGGRISSEWFLAKSLQILDEAPAIYAAADRLIEAADWIVWQLTGVETRNSCTAGYKAQWSRRVGFPDAGFLGALDPRFADLVDTRMSRDIRALGERAGEVTEAASRWTGLRPGTPVAIANVDAHVSVPAVGVTTPGQLVAVMGTSTCHLALSVDERVVPGACGVVEDGIIPGLFGHEAGQASVGDLFGWWVRTATTWGPSTHSSNGMPRACDRVRRVSLRSTGGTATAPSSWTPSSRACSWGPRSPRDRRTSTGHCWRRPCMAPASSSRAWRAPACPSRASSPAAACLSRIGC